MVRLNLLIADFDESFLVQLANYLQNRHGTSFNVNYVTSEGHLGAYLSKHRDSLDILLVSPSLARALYAGAQTTVILLSDGRIDHSDADYPLLDKYQRGDQLASRVLQIYLDQHPGQRYITAAPGSNRLIGVFSPSGGCGKSTLAAGLSAMAYHQGKRAMYLNMEGCDSTEAWFSAGTSPSISELFYHLKDGASQLSLKIEALSYTDPATRVRSFMPADTLLDFNEVTETDLELLTDALRRMEDLDVAFVDLSASVDSKNLKIMELMDQVLLVEADDNASQVKVQRFIRQLPALERKRNADYTGKTILVRNGRYGPGFRTLETVALKKVCMLPKDPVLRQDRGIMDKLGGPFGQGLLEVWNHLELRQVHHDI